MDNEMIEQTPATDFKHLQSLRKTRGAGSGRPLKAAPKRAVGEWSDPPSHACQLKIAGASLQYIADELGLNSRQRAAQVLQQAERLHPALFKRAMSAGRKKAKA